MYKDDYISAFGKLAPSEAWKAETLKKMHALERQQREGRESFGRPAGHASTAVFATASAETKGPTAEGHASAAAERMPEKNASAKKPAPLAVHLRRAALPIAAMAMLAILPMTTLRGCGASGGNSSMALQMEDAAGADTCAPASYDTVGTMDTGAPDAPAGAPSGEASPRDGVTEESQYGADPMENQDIPAPSPAEDGTGAFSAAGGDASDRKKFSIVYGGKPFRALDADEITFATVCLAPPDTTLEIPDIEELAGLLQDVIVYSRDDSYTEYSGQGVIFTLTFADGAETQIMAYNPFLVIDGVGYRTEYAPCEALNQYANDLLRSGEAVTVLAQPPAMAVIGTFDRMNHTTLQGGYSWQSKNAGGTVTDTEADSAHPLACKAQLTPALEMENDRTLNLIFPQGAAPDEIVRVRCWSDADWGKTTAKSETVRVSGSASGGGYAIEVKPGGYIYEVTARWDNAGGYGGTASYAFYVKGIA